MSTVRLDEKRRQIEELKLKRHLDRMRNIVTDEELKALIDVHLEVPLTCR